MTSGFTQRVIHKYMPFESKVKKVISAGVDAIEISQPCVSHFLKLKLDKKILDKLKNVEYISIHAPRRGIIYGNNEITKKTIEKIEELSSKLEIKAIIIHPDRVEDYSLLEKSELPFLIENLDSRHPEWANPSDFIRLKKDFKFGFCLDLAHCYIFDKSMNLGREFADFFGNRLKEFHVSGYDKGHVPLCIFKDREKIKGILKENKKIARISEGKIYDFYLLKLEIDYLKEII